MIVWMFTPEQIIENLEMHIKYKFQSSTSWCYGAQDTTGIIFDFQWYDVNNEHHNDCGAIYVGF